MNVTVTSATTQSPTFTPTTAGTYRVVASYSGDSNYGSAGPTACLDPAEDVVVTPKPVALATNVNPDTIVLGGSFQDSATLSGLVAGTPPTGTMTFTVYKGNDCTVAPAFGPVTVAVSSATTLSPTFTPTSAGTYRVVASYSGDSNYGAAGPTACLDPAEDVLVTPKPVTLATNVNPDTITLGGSFQDSATLSGLIAGIAPTGTMTFTVYKGNDCTIAPAFGPVTVAVSSATTLSPTFTPTSAGTYRVVASYSGDGNYSAAGPTACLDSAEDVVVPPKPVTLATNVNPDTITLGGSFQDSATLSGLVAGIAPSGTMTFTVYKGNDCTVSPAFGPVTVAVSSATTLSPTFTPTSTGTYRVVASYSGDSNYGAAGPTACLDPAEDVLVNPKAVTLTTNVNPDTITLGGSFQDSATLSGLVTGTPPTGTMTFTVYKGNDCTVAPAFGPVSVNVSGETTLSPTFTPTSAGTYRVVASYSGDSNYNSAGPTACLDPAEDVVVNPKPVTLATNVNPDTIVLGGSFQDSATLSGLVTGIAPTGTMTFTVFKGDNCTIAPAFGPVTVNVSSATTLSPTFTPTSVGTYRVVASYSGDGNYPAAGPTACLDPAEDVLVTPKPVTLSTSVNPDTMVLGGSFQDSATLSGLAPGVAPGGTMTFTVYKGNDCTVAPAFGPVNVAVTGATTLSPVWTPTTTGTYRVVASYSGDTNYPATGPTACLDPAEDVVVAGKLVTLTTDVDPDTMVLGGTFQDSATLSGLIAGTPPTGTMTFTVWKNDTCTGSPAFGPVTVNVTSATTLSPVWTPTSTGTYRVVASYSGDLNYTAAGPTSCLDPAEDVVVTPKAVSLTTDVDPDTIVLGQTFQDSATLSGLVPGVAPSGTMTFTVWKNDTCTGTPAFGPASVPVTSATTLSPIWMPATTGTYRVVASYTGDGNYGSAGPTACLDPAEDVVVSPKAVTLATDVDPDTIVLGQTFQDSATLSGLVAGTPPTGTMTFTVFKGDTCTIAPAFGPVTVNVTGATTLSPIWTPTSTGTYRVVASYSGDSNYSAAGPTACLDDAEDVVVTAKPLALTTSVNPDNITLGDTFRDQATLTGLVAGVAPGGTMTFTVWGPNNNSCTGTPAFGPVNVAVSSGTTLSPIFTPTLPGRYRVVASYSGDTNYPATGPTACLDPEEDVVVGPKAVQLTTLVNPDTITLGGTFRDTATLSGLVAGTPPTGTMTFTVYGPNNNTCTGSPAFGPVDVAVTSATTLSPVFMPSVTGRYRVVAAYSGDSHYNAAGPTACLDDAEDVVVSPKALTLTTNVNPDAIALGDSFRDTATLTGIEAGTPPTGTMTFTVYKNDTCTGVPAFGPSNVAVTGATTLSPSYTPTSSGTYRVVASYSGDANYAAAGPTACLDPAEDVVVGPKPVTLTTDVDPDEIVIGQTFRDTATLSGLNPGTPPTGTMTFTVYGPNNNTCTGAPAFGPVNVTVTGATTQSPAFLPTIVGRYRVVASYSGDGTTRPSGRPRASIPRRTSSSSATSTSRRSSHRTRSRSAGPSGIPRRSRAWARASPPRPGPCASTSTGPTTSTARGRPRSRRAP